MKLFAAIFLALSVFCLAQKPEVLVPGEKPPLLPPTPKTKKWRQPKMSVEKKLQYYFLGREIEPSIIVNNTEGNQTKIDLEDNRIEWIQGEKEIKIKINDDVFSLEGEKTLNDVERERKDDIDFADNWEQIKLYKFGERKLIGISMKNEPCTGIGCSVAFQLIYDLQTKSKTFFGTFRIEREVRLFDFGNDGTLDYLGKTYIDGGAGGGEINNVYRLYTMDEKGVFHLRLDKNQKPYFIKRVFEADYTEIDKKFAASWIEEIK